MDKYRKNLKQLAEIQTLGEGRYRDGQYVKVGGIIAANKIRTTKAGDSMAVFMLEDFSSKIEVVAFPKTFAMSSKNIYPESIVMVEGRLMLDEEEPRLMASQVTKLEAAPSDVKLFIPASLENPETQKALGRIFASYRGNNPVYLHLLGSKKIIRAEQSFWVDAKNPGLISELRSLLGDKGVVI